MSEVTSSNDSKHSAFVKNERELVGNLYNSSLQRFLKNSYAKRIFSHHPYNQPFLGSPVTLNGIPFVSYEKSAGFNWNSRPVLFSKSSLLHQNLFRLHGNSLTFDFDRYHTALDNIIRQIDYFPSIFLIHFTKRVYWNRRDGILTAYLNCGRPLCKSELGACPNQIKKIC